MQITFITSLDDNTGSVSVYAINDEDSAVGQGLDGVVLWTGPTPVALGIDGQPAAINDSGAVVGNDDSSSSGASQAFLWKNGSLTLLATPVESTSFANAINASGQIVGEIDGSDDIAQAVLWQNNQAIQLGTLGGAGAYASSINNSGQIVGASHTASGTQHAFLWQNGTIKDLGVLASGDNSYANQVNSAGVIVGYDSPSSNDFLSTAVLWHGGVIQALPTLSGDSFTSATSINDSGLIVGFAGGNPLGSQTAVMWQNGQVIDLNTLLPAKSGWYLGEALAINNNDQIVGYGSYEGLGTSFELTLGTGGTVEIGTSARTALGPIPSEAVSVVDSAADVLANLDGLQSFAAAGKLTGIALTDSGTPTLSISAAQLNSDAKALAAISGSYALDIAAGTTAVSIAAPIGHAATVQFSGTVGQYSLTDSGDGTFTVGQGGITDHLSNVTALQFDDQAVIVAAAPGPVGAVTTGNITELYSAVLGREPDAPGLTYYQAALQANPATSLVTFAQYFLASPEYADNPEHAYAANSQGDAQFITDSYDNLLHRAPADGDVAWYQTNVIAKFLAGLTAGTAAYAQAETQAHAQLLVYFSASAEFLADVQITAQNAPSAQHWLFLV